MGGISQNFWIFSSSTFGVKIDHAKMMINAEEEISNKNFWVLSARARARARAHGAFPRGWAPTALVHKEVYKCFWGVRAAIFDFKFSSRACAFWGLFVLRAL